MNEIVNNFLLVGDKSITEINLRQHAAIGKPRFTCSTCELFTKNKERIRKFKETGDSWYIYHNELNKSCFQHDMAYRDLKDLPRRTASENTLRNNKVFNIAKNLKYDEFQRGVASMVCKFFDKKAYSSNTSGGAVKSKYISHQELAKELQKPIIIKFQKPDSILTF